MTATTVLSAEGLAKRYGERRVVDGVSLAVQSQEIVGLLGPNGAGKTTTFNMLVGLVAVDSGRVLFDHHDVTSISMHRRARRGLGYLPQESSVFRRLSVADNILAILELQRDTTDETRRARTEELLAEFELAHLKASLGERLSGGERRRLEIARCLAHGPKIVMLDEPFAGIDPIAISDLQRLILKLKNKGIGVLITDHNVRETLAICTRAYLMSEGRILESGPSEVLINSERARRVYLGDGFVAAPRLIPS